MPSSYQSNTSNLKASVCVLIVYCRYLQMVTTLSSEHEQIRSWSLLNEKRDRKHFFNILQCAIRIATGSKWLTSLPNTAYVWSCLSCHLVDEQALIRGSFFSHEESKVSWHEAHLLVLSNLFSGVGSGYNPRRSTHCTYPRAVNNAHFPRLEIGYVEFLRYIAHFYDIFILGRAREKKPCLCWDNVRIADHCDAKYQVSDIL